MAAPMFLVWNSKETIMSSSSNKPGYISKENKARAIRNLHLDKLKKTTTFDVETLPVISPRAAGYSPRSSALVPVFGSENKPVDNTHEMPQDNAVVLAHLKPMNQFYPTTRYKGSALD